MAFKVSDITTAIKHGRGLAKPNMFLVRITPPSSLVSSAYPREAVFFCDAAQLPGLNFNSQPIKVSGYGTSELRPTEASFSPLNTTFIVDARGRAFRFFQRWLALINNWSRETTGVMQGTQLAFGEWNYPSTYEGTVEVLALDPSGGPEGKEIISYQLSKAFPLQVGDVNVAWEMNDSIMRLPVVFAYNTWNTTNVPPTLSSESINSSQLATSSDLKKIDQYGYGLSLLKNGTTPAQAAQFANLE